MKNFLETIMSRVAMMTIVVMTTVACSDSKENVGSDEEQSIVENPTKIITYGGSTQFVNDLETLVDYGCAVYAMRVAFWNIASNDFKTGEPFCATPEDMDKNTSSSYDFYDLASSIVEKADLYDAAFQRLQQEGVLDKPADARTTRGWLSDAVSFVFGLKKSQEVGRKSVLAVIQQSGWQNDDNMLQKLFEAVSPGRRQGYTSARQFWADFSQGELDAKSNQVFQDLYHNADLDFGTNALDLGFTPTGNMTKTAAQLIEKGISVIIDAAPGGMAGAMTMGKDIYNTYDATETVVKKTVKGDLSEDDVKKLITQWASNCINYGDRVVNYVNNGSTDGIIDMWDTPKEFFGQEFANALLNDGVDFGDLVIEKNFGRSGEDVITVVAGNGQKIDLVVVQDDKGNVRLGVKQNGDGSFSMKDSSGDKTVTAANKNGASNTKNVSDGEKEVNVDMTKKEENDEPKNGYISFEPESVDFEPEGSEQTIKVTTNYLYYDVTPSVDDGYWLDASPIKGTNEFTITAKPNDSGEPRIGTILVRATNKKGNVLKFVTLKATQQPVSEEITVTPATLEFTSQVGHNQVSINTGNYQYVDCEVNPFCTGWLSAKIESTSEGQALMRVSVEENKTFVQRSGSIYVRAGNSPNLTDDNAQTVEVTVTQSRMSTETLYCTISPWSFDINSNDTTLVVNVSTNGNNVSATSNDNWIHILEENTTAVTIKVDANKNPAKRSGTITVTSQQILTDSEGNTIRTGMSEDVDIYQEAGSVEAPVLYSTWDYNQTIGGKTTTYRLILNKNGTYTSQTIINKEVTESSSGTFSVYDYSERKNTTYNYTEVHGEISFDGGSRQAFYSAKFEVGGPLYLIIGSTRYKQAE